MALKSEVTVQLDIVEFTENDAYIVYSPALDLSGYGNDKDEAMNAFMNILADYIEYASNKKCLWKDLKKHGWKKTKKGFSAPGLVHYIEKNEWVKALFDDCKEFIRSSVPVQMPVLA